MRRLTQLDTRVHRVTVLGEGEERYMTYYVHRSETKAGLTAITRDKEGGKLDRTAGPWILLREVEEDKTRGLTGFPSDIDALNADLDKAGVQYTRVGVHFDAVPSRPKPPS